MRLVPRTFARQLAGLAATPAAPAPQQASTVRAAFAHGRHDALVNADYPPTVPAPTRRGPPVHELPGAGHTPPQEAPAAFAAVLAAFAGWCCR